jgi:hypothetical protein
VIRWHRRTKESNAGLRTRKFPKQCFCSVELVLRFYEDSKEQEETAPPALLKPFPPKKQFQYTLRIRTTHDEVGREKKKRRRKESKEDYRLTTTVDALLF